MRAAAFFFFFFFFFFFNFFSGGGGGGVRVGMEIWRVSDKRTKCFRRSMPESPYGNSCLIYDRYFTPSL